MNKKPFASMGLIFLVMAFTFFPIIAILMNSLVEPHQKYDYQAIETHGKEYNATILNIRPVNNVTINGAHPVLFYYTYNSGNQTITDRFQTMDLDEASRIKTGNTVPVKAYNEQSMLAGFEPFTFPVYIFFLILIPFLLIGLIFFLISLVPALKIFNLYKHGLLKEGIITAIIPMPAKTPFDKGSILATYTFKNAGGQTVHGETITRDFSILSFKKVGDPVKIYVSDENSSASVMEPVKKNWVA